MKIIKLQGENFKRLKAFEIVPQGNTVLITGRNGQGKSSVLDSIVLTLAGGKTELAKLTTKPIRDGATSAEVTVETEQYTITRTWSASGSKLQIISREGEIMGSPQEVLNGFVGGGISFDPLTFTHLKPKEQREELLEIVKLDIDLVKWQKEHDITYGLRTEVNQEIKSLKGKIDLMPSPPSDTPDEEDSMTQASIDYQAAVQHNDKLQDQRERVKRIQEEGQELRRKLEAKLKEHEDAVTVLAALGEPKDVAAAQKRLIACEERNKNVRLKKDLVSSKTQLKKLEADAAQKTQHLEDLQAQKSSALARAQFPIAGLSFSDDEVLMNGIPFAQLSSAQQLKVSMAIAMAKNPELRVIRITDGSLLDDENLKVIEEMAKDKDFQVWIERVDTSGKVGIVIEDGEIVTPAPQP